MTNEEYLIISYFVIGAVAVIIALAAYLWLRPAVKGITQKLSGQHLRRILKKTLPLSLFFPALLGFCSVTFRSCDKDTYDKIIAERSYLVEKNQEQLSKTLSYVSVGIIVLGGVVLMVLIASGCQRRIASPRSSK